MEMRPATMLIVMVMFGLLFLPMFFLDLDPPEEPAPPADAPSVNAAPTGNRPPGSWGMSPEAREAYERILERERKRAEAGEGNSGPPANEPVAPGPEEGREEPPETPFD